MLRSVIMALGLCSCILGGQAMFVDHFVMADDLQTRYPDVYEAASPYMSNGYDQYGNGYSPAPANNEFGYGDLAYDGLDYGRFGQRRILIPPEWAPWGFLSGGILGVLYAASLPTYRPE